MGGYESKVVENKGPKANFSDSRAAPAKVLFSPDLLKQLHHEQEEKLQHQQRLIPRTVIFPEEPEHLERERRARYENLRRAVAAKAEERTRDIHEEEEAIRKAYVALDKFENKKSERTVVQGSGDQCMDKMTAMKQMMDGGNFHDAFKQLNAYERCARDSANSRRVKNAL